jgi:2-phosphosulfolactate phosphatase
MALTSEISPFEISGRDFRGQTIIQRTSAGTQGIVAASQAERLYAASLVTAEGTVRALLSGSPGQVSLVAMGDNGSKRTDEDELCAIHLRNRLEGRLSDADAICRLFGQGAKSGTFTIRPVPICTRRTWTSRSTSIATILP